MVIWSGYGILVFLIIFLNSLIVNLITNYITNDDNFYHKNLIPIGISFLFSAIFIKIIWDYLNKKRLGKMGTRLIDKVTIAAGDQNKFFFIPFRYWSYIIFCLGFTMILGQIILNIFS